MGEGGAHGRVGPAQGGFPTGPLSYAFLCGAQIGCLRVSPALWRDGLAARPEAALKIGATRKQIVETVLHLVFYAGGPAVRNSLVALGDLFAQRQVNTAEARPARNVKKD
jgi:carboxymuconolactone decarboxylase family protein